MKCIPLDWSTLKSIKMAIFGSNFFSLVVISIPRKCCNTHPLGTIGGLVSNNSEFFDLFQSFSGIIFTPDDSAKV